MVAEPLIQFVPHKHPADLYGQNEFLPINEHC